MRSELEILVSGLKEAAIAAGDFIGHNAMMHNIYTEKPLKRPGDTSNPVTELDKEGEKIVVQYLKRLPFADRLQIHGEEHKYHPNKRKDAIRVDIDPIDGTKSWVRGEFVSSLSIGAHIGDQHAGVVYDFMRGILYATDVDAKDKTKLVATATFRNHSNIERMLPVHKKQVLNQYKIPSDDPMQYKKMFGEKPKYDIIGSIALGLAHVAYGALDGIVMESKRTSYYDLSGGLAVAKASGAIVTNYAGNEVTPQNHNRGIIVMRPHVKVQL